MAQKKSFEDLEIPAGYIHREQLRVGRGWDTTWMAQLTDVVLVDTGGVPNLSNKAYNLGEVLAYEAANPKVGKAVAEHLDAAASYIAPTEGVEYTVANALTTAQLRARGWTPAHVARILHHPDVLGQYKAGDRYGLDRVEAAEANDERLGKTIARQKAKREEELADATSATGFVFRKYQDAWCAWGRVEDVPTDRVITISKKDGTTVEKVAGAPVADEVNPGFGFFPVRNLPRKSAEPAASTPATAKSHSDSGVRARAKQRRTLTEWVEPYRAWDVGQVLEEAGKKWKIISVKKHYITSDDPSVFGSHLLGEEYSWGWRAIGELVEEKED